MLVASASSGIELSISSDKVIQGDIANVVISLANCENVTGVNMTLVYDESIVSLNSITKNTSVMSVHSVSSNDLGSGKVSISISGLDTIPTADTPVIDVAMNGDVSGNSDMKLEGIEFITTDSSSPTVAVSNGEINVNSGPVLAEIVSQTINETETLTLTLSATDADNDPLIYFKDVGFGSISGNDFSWTPASGDNGTYTINFTVSDGYEEDSGNVTINVNKLPMYNHPPVFNSINDINTTVGNLVTFTVSATDQDHNYLTYYNTSVLPEGAVFYPDNQSFVWTPSSNGTYNVNFGVDDGNGGTDSVVVRIIVDDVVVAINNPPVLTPIGDRSVNESELLTITLNATDADGDALTYSSNASFGNITTANVFTWNPDYNSSGIYAVNFSVSDGNGGTDSEIINITVNDVVVVTNSAPVFTPIADRTVNESELLMITLNATDVDGDLLTYSSNASFGNITGDVFSWTPDSSDIGTHYVNFSVTDGSLWDHYVAKITVNEVASPVYTSADPVNFITTTGNFWVLHDWDAGTGNVADGFNVSYNGTWYNTTDSMFNDSVRLNAHDWSNITVYAYNATSSTLSSGIESNVQIPNNPVSIIDVASSYSINEGETLYIDANYTDLDGDIAAFSSNDTDIFNIDAATGVASWTTKHKDIGTHNVELTATDGYGSEESQVVEITVTNVNNPPVFTAIGSQSVNEGQELAFTVNATDVDGDTLTYNVIGLPSGVTLDSNSGDFTWTPDYNMAGDYTANFSVTDGEHHVYQEVGITVENTNRAPEFPVINTQYVAENNTIALDVGATDADNDSLAYSCNASFGTFDNVNHTFTWTPGFDDAGIHYVKFTVADTSTEDNLVVTFDVTNVNRIPVFRAIADQSVSEGNPLSFTVNATDDDGTALTYSAIVLPSGATFDSGSGDFTWTPGYNMNGSYTANFSVSDGESIVYQEIGITVTNTNRAPVLDYIQSVSVNETENVTITLNAIDPDGDSPLYYSMNSSKGNLDDNVFTWTPGYEDKGIHHINFTVSDGDLSSTQMAVIGVNNTNRAPEFTSIVGTQIINEGGNISFKVTAADADGDDLTYSVSGDPETSTIEFTSTGITFNWSPSYTEAGNYTITFIVKDEMLYSDTLKVPIQVLDVNRAPRFTLNSSYEINETNTLTIDLDPYDEDTDDVVSVWINNTGNASGSLSSSGVYTWNTDYYDSGIYNIEFGISDGTVTSYSNTTVTVNDVNAPPVLGTIGSKSVDEEEELTINLTATDIDGNSLEFTIENKPGNATFDTSTGNFSWTPIDGETGTYYVLFGVTDGTDIDTENVTIKVTSGSSSSSSSSSSGGGGGGGGGSLSSGEKFENIFIKDYVLKSIVKDSEAVFSFYKENNSIVSVSFTPKLNGGQVKAVVEMLYGTSSQVSSDAPGNVYKNMNIYVDTKLSADSMGNSKINFKVEKEWVDENEIDPSTITLCRYSGGWNELPTELKGEDEEYYYFIATTPGFSPFAISSIDPALEVTEESSAEATDGSAENAESMMSTEDVAQEISTETQQEGQSSIVPVIVLLGVIALTIVGIFGYRNRDYYEKVRLQLGNPDGKRYRRTKK
nr:Ig-like domain-containing protein [uncultured Methanolobus sp.]